MQGIFRPVLVRRMLAVAAALAALSLAARGLALVLVSSTNSRNSVDMLTAGGWVWCVAWVTAACALAWEAWDAGISGRTHDLSWRLAAAASTLVIAIGALVTAAGGTNADNTVGNVVQAMGIIMWALVLVAVLLYRMQVTRGNVNRQEAGALTLGAVALVCIAVSVATPGPSLGDVTPAVVGAVFSAIGFGLAAWALMHGYRPGRQVVEIPTIIGAMIIMSLNGVLGAVAFPLVIRASASLTSIRIGLSVPQFAAAIGLAILAWAAVPSLWDTHPIAAGPGAGPDTPASPWMMTPHFCPYCGAPLAFAMRFCPHCGHPINAHTPPRF